MRRRGGFTLLELVIAVTLLALVTASFGLLQTGALRAFFQSANWASSQSEAAFGMEHMKRNLIVAREIYSPIPPTAVGQPKTSLVLLFRLPDPIQTPGIELTLQYVLVNPNPSLQVTPDLQVIRTQIDWNQDPPQITPTMETVARNISWLRFTRTGTATIRIEITSEHARRRDRPRRTTLRTVVIPPGMVADWPR